MKPTIRRSPLSGRWYLIFIGVNDQRYAHPFGSWWAAFDFLATFDKLGIVRREA